MHEFEVWFQVRKQAKSDGLKGVTLGDWAKFLLIASAFAFSSFWGMPEVECKKKIKKMQNLYSSMDYVAGYTLKWRSVIV